MKATEQMKVLAQSLPFPDRQRAFELIGLRDFETLHELVGSALYKTRKNLYQTETPSPIYLDTNTDDMSTLLDLVDNYRNMGEIDPIEIEDEFDYFTSAEDEPLIEIDDQEY